MPLLNPAFLLQGNALASAATHLALHSATPDASGSNQTSAARQSVAWTVNGTTGALSLPGAKNFTGGASNGSVTHVGLWSAATGGTFYGYAPVTGDASFNSAGEYTLDSLSATGS